MLATATVVEIDNQVIRHRYKIVVNVPREVLIPRLIAAFTDYEKEADESEFRLSLRITPERVIRIGIYPRDAQTVERFADFLAVVAWETRVQELDSAKDFPDDTRDDLQRDGEGGDAL